MTSFGAFALALSSIGLYGLLACRVASRTREIGIRMALGASRRNVIAPGAASPMRLVGVAVAAGVVLSIVTTRSLQSQLFGIASTDPVSMAGAVSAMVVGGSIRCSTLKSE